MHLTESSVQAREYYAAHLKAAVEELAITQAQLAEAIGKDQKTVFRYISGETYPEGCVAEIEEYLLSRAANNYFVHIPSEKFGAIFSEIYDYLRDNHITEAVFAKKIGIAQKTLNNYHNSRFNTGKPVKLATETQYKIIEAFRELGREVFRKNDDEDETEADIKNRSRYYAILNKLKPYQRVNSAKETWDCLINSLRTGGGNFFTYAPEKLELVRFYLYKLIGFFKDVWNTFYDERRCHGGCSFYAPPDIIASIDFLREFQGDSEFIDDAASKGGIESLTFRYCTEFFFENTARYVEIYDTFSDSEKAETNALLRAVFDQRKRSLKENWEYIQTLSIPDYESYIEAHRSKAAKITDEEAAQLIEMFSGLPSETQYVILNNFVVFFYGIALDVTDELRNMRRWLTEITGENKLKFVEVFENDILSGFWESCSRYNNDYDDLFDRDIWELYSQYMALMSWAMHSSQFRFVDPSEKYTKRFSKKIRCLHSEDDPVFVMKARLDHSPLDWYANLLVDLAYVKKMDLWKIMFGERGVYYDMDEYIKLQNTKKKKRERQNNL